MPSADILSAFFATALLMALVPGPDNLFVLTQSAVYGARAGFATTFGLITGLCAHTAAVTLEGGTGRAKVESPAALRCENGRFWATIVWSSSNFDYMKVDGEKYELISEPGGNSTFEIPVAAFDQKLDVIADTVAMSEPHEVEYTLLFDSATLQKQ